MDFRWKMANRLKTLLKRNLNKLIRRSKFATANFFVKSSKLFGVAKGMTCSHGNSAEIDSAGLIDFSQTFCGCQNDMDWNVSERPK